MQQGCTGFVLELSGKCQRRPAKIVCHPVICTGIQQHPDNFQVAIECSQMQNGITVVIGNIQGRFRLDQQTKASIKGTMNVVTINGIVHGCATGIISDIKLSASMDKSFQAIATVFNHSQMQCGLTIKGSDVRIGTGADKQPHAPITAVDDGVV